MLEQWGMYHQRIWTVSILRRKMVRSVIYSFFLINWNAPVHRFTGLPVRRFAGFAGHLPRHFAGGIICCIAIGRTRSALCAAGHNRRPFSLLKGCSFSVASRSIPTQKPPFARGPGRRPQCIKSRGSNRNNSITPEITGLKNPRSPPGKSKPRVQPGLIRTAVPQPTITLKRKYNNEKLLSGEKQISCNECGLQIATIEWTSEPTIQHLNQHIASGPGRRPWTGRKTGDQTSRGRLDHN